MEEPVWIAPMLWIQNVRIVWIKVGTVYRLDIRKAMSRIPCTYGDVTAQ